MLTQNGGKNQLQTGMKYHQIVLLCKTTEIIPQQDYRPIFLELSFLIRLRVVNHLFQPVPP